MSIFSPTTEEDLATCLRDAAAGGRKLRITGQDSKTGFGQAVTADQAVSVGGFAGIHDYEPAELVLTAGAGTAMAVIEQALAEKQQQLAFEPGDWAPIWGGTEGAGTIGGILACNMSGPRRFQAGAARDHFLGFTAVNGRGEIYKGGGKVVKNVTGYDLPKLLAGSFGTLSVMTEVTVKVLPRAEKQRTILLFGEAADAANRSMIAAIGSTYDIGGACYLPAALAQKSQVDFVAKAGTAVTALRVEGSGPSVEHRCAALRQMFGGESEELHSMRSVTFWREIRDVTPLRAPLSRILWRVSLPPAQGASFVAALPAMPVAEWFMDWGGGLVWVSLASDTAIERLAALRATAATLGGHATLMRASDQTRRDLGVIAPAALEPLMRRIKESFDPAGVLNPGRMMAGW
ncbi:MAG TPA: glycolate oxidase subunit GlcE [Dongiaceae bacterium]|nr:glycolate oxidase subunit GlcE [Dongiaceae bacterium]